MDKKGFMNQLSGMALAVITVAVIIGVGLVVLTNLGNSVGGTANSTIVTVSGYLGTSSGGLASWIPAIIAIVIGLLIIAGFSGKKY